jgi:transcriptional regulator with XRE-family HTH domain
MTQLKTPFKSNIMQQKLTAYLKAHNLTVYRFAKDNGFNQITVMNWVKGSSLPSYKNLEKLNKIIK